MMGSGVSLASWPRGRPSTMPGRSPRPMLRSGPWNVSGLSWEGEEGTPRQDSARMRSVLPVAVARPRGPRLGFAAANGLGRPLRGFGDGH